MHDAADMGRFLAVSGWLAWQVRRPFRRTALRRFGSAPAYALAGLLLVIAALPIVLPLLDAQPTDVDVPDIFDGAVSEPGTWIRVDGRAFALESSPTTASGNYALLVDAERHLRAVVVRAPQPFPDEDAEEVAVRPYSGRLVLLPVTVDMTALPIEATEAGTPPQVVADRIIELDAATKPERSVWWPLAVLPVLLAALLIVGAGVGYPVFRPTKEVDVLAAPLGVGERLPAAWGGRIGPVRSDLADPLGALLLVRRGTTGNVLTAQPLADEGPAPAPVTIGGGWTAGRTGYVHALRETVPALAIRSELVDAIFLFSRTAERDRVAAMVTVDR
jgi:hypothetical protein